MTSSDGVMHMSKLFLPCLFQLFYCMKQVNLFYSCFCAVIDQKMSLLAKNKKSRYSSRAVFFGLRTL